MVAFLAYFMGVFGGEGCRRGALFKGISFLQFYVLLLMCILHSLLPFSLEIVVLCGIIYMNFHASEMLHAIAFGHGKLRKLRPNIYGYEL
jgi:hypothetical protein